MNIPIGGEINSSVKITNTEKNTETIKVSLNNFKDLASLSQNEFVLNPKDSGELIVQFKDLKGKAGVYVGKLIIESSLNKDEIPIVLGVEDSNAAFAIIQSSIPKYDMVYPGGKLGIDFKTFDLVGSNVPTIGTDYYIKNLDNEVLLSGNTDLIVGTGSKSEIIDIPKDWTPGDYVFVSQIEYKNTTTISSYLFSISSNEGNSIFSSQAFLIAIIVFVVIIIILILFFIQSRDSLLVELKKQQGAEIKRSLRYIQNSKKLVSESREKPEKKKIKIIHLENAKRNIIKKLKEKQKKQRQEITKLKKNKAKKNTLKGKIESWKKEGYKIPEADKEVKKITKKGVKEQLKDWKKEGYDTGFLNK